MRGRFAALAVGIGLWVLGEPVFADDDGFRVEPRLGYTRGEHRLDVPLELRWRWENWKAFTTEWDAFNGVRARFGADYRYAERFRLFAQGQLSSVLGLGSNANGVGAVYRANSPGGDSTDVTSVRVSQLFGEARRDESTWLRIGRQYITMGTLVSYEESNWTFLRRRRLAQRLVGTVDWSLVARAYDGGAGRFEHEGYSLHAFLAQPTTGVFDVAGAYRPNWGILFGGIDGTIERGKLLDNTELGAFFIGYSDDRNPADVRGLFGEIQVYTLGARWLGIYPLGPGRADVLLWGALQLGSYVDEGPTSGVRRRDQRAHAAIGEVGYQLPELWAAPWLRVGVNYASGDHDRDDDRRTTFFNLLPTNHLYYGYLDQLAFQNLIDLLVQLRLAPLPKLRVELTYHRFWLPQRNDFRWAGTGAFTKNNLGYLRFSSNGSNELGGELDLVASYTLRKGIAFTVGYARLQGGAAFGDRSAPGQSEVAQFAFVQIALAY